jgi:hypothetical protein
MELIVIADEASCECIAVTCNIRGPTCDLERVVVLRMQRVDLQHLLQQFLVQRRPSADIRTQSVAHRRRPLCSRCDESGLPVLLCATPNLRGPNDHAALAQPMLWSSVYCAEPQSDKVPCHSAGHRCGCVFVLAHAVVQPVRCVGRCWTLLHAVACCRTRSLRKSICIISKPTRSRTRRSSE